MATFAGSAPRGSSFANSVMRCASSSAFRTKSFVGYPAAKRRGVACCDVSDSFLLTFVTIALNTNASVFRSRGARRSMPARTPSSSRSTCASNSATSAGG